MIENHTTQAMPRARRATTFDFGVNLNTRWTMALVVAGLILYVALAWLGWQAYVPFAWLRFGVAWLLLLTPGLLLQQLLWRDVSTSQHVAVGFGVSIALGGFFGLIATALHLALWFVIAALTLVTISCAILVAARNHWQCRARVHFQISYAFLWMLVPLGLACLIILRLTYGLAFDNDDLTYNAYITHWLEAARYDWLQVPLDVTRIAPSRFWLAYWPLNQALLAKWSALHPIELTRFYLAPSLAVFAMLATYALARAFDMSRVVSIFAVTMQTTALLLMTALDQAGFVFFNRLVEDKVVTAFILIPLLVVVVTAFLKQHTRGRFVLVILVGTALVFTHPTLMAVGVAATTLFTIFSSLPKRDWRGLGAILFVLFLMLSAPMGMRLFDANYTDKIPFDVETLQRADQLRRVWEWGSSLYTIHPSLFLSLPFLWTIISAIAALFEWKTSFAARWILAATIVFISVINPLTTWLWGFAIGASQIWRVLWFLPFGIAAAYLTLFVWRRVLRARWENISTSRAVMALAMCAVILLLVPFVLLWQNRNESGLHSLRNATKSKDKEYAKLLAFKSELDAHLAEPTVVFGASRWLNDRLPALSSNARVFTFRIALNMWKLHNLKWEDARARVNAGRKLQSTKTSTAEQLDLLKKYNVELIVAEPGTQWVEQLAQAAPEQIQSIGTSNSMELYRVNVFQK